MTIAVTRLDFIVYASRMSSVYAHAFDNVQQILDRYEITDKPLRLAHFIAQVMAESEALNRCTEDLCYGAERIVKEWPLHFQPHTRNDPADFAGKPEALADVVYGGRMGNTAPGDGFAYRGRGLLQLTGKDGYRHVTGLLREAYPDAPDLVADPDQAFAPAWSLSIAAAFWKDKGANQAADSDSIERVTRAVNGGTDGLQDRRRWFERVAAHLLPS